MKQLLMLSAAVAVMSSCSSNSGSSVTSLTEPAGPNCAYGGVRLTSGSGVSYVCNGAPADTAAQVLAKVESVDGQGSGLDADLLAGHPASEFLFSAGTGLTQTGNQFSVDLGSVQARISGTCTPGAYITAVDASGAVRCTAPLRRTTVVSPVGTPVENGAALLVAMNGITATASSPWLLKIEPGTYDLGTNSLLLKAYVDVEGSGEAVTTITSQVTGAGTTSSGTVIAPALAAAPEVRSLTITDTNPGDTAVGVYVDVGGRVRLSHVTLSGAGAVYDNSGLAVRGGSAEARNITVSPGSYTETFYGSITLFDSELLGPLDMTTDGTQTASFEVRNSRVMGTLYVESGGGPASMKIAGSLVSGSLVRVAPATITCINDFNSSYAPLTASCQ